MSNATLNVDTVIPTAARIAVRNVIVTAPGFDAWRVAATNDTKTRALSKAQWFDAAHALGVVDRVLDLIANPPAMPEAEPMQDHPSVEPFEAPAAPAMPEGETVSADMVLDIVRPFLGVALVDKIDAALAPIVALANRPPVVQTVERVVYETLAPGAKAPALAPAFAGDTSTIGKVFGIRGKLCGNTATFWNAVDKPKVDEAYVPDSDLVSRFVSAMEKGKFVWLAGPAGSGKTTLPEQVAAKLHRPFVRIAFNRATEPTDLIGMDKLDGAGGMAWSDGALVKAIRRPGTVILLDEPTFAPPGIAATLQTLLDNKRITLPTGEVVKCAAGVYFCAADNTRGYGDETGRYAGTMQANSALIDRFAFMYVVDYMSVDKEAQALANHTLAPRAACETVAEFVKLARALPGFGDVPLSLRRMIAFVTACQCGDTAKRAFSDSFLTRLPDSEREALNAAFRTHFPDGVFDAQLSGGSVPAPVSQDPAQAAARNAFDPIEE